MYHSSSILEINKRRIWTPDAINCLKKHFRCSICQHSKLSSKCRMKDTVIGYIRKYGQPKEYIEPTIRED